MMSRASVKASAAERRIVGRVIRRDGLPVAGLSVTAHARRLRSEKRLGKAVTGSDGSYRIEYAPPKGAFDLVIRASSKGSDDASPVEEVRENPGPDETVDLTVPDSPEPEYARLLAEVTPLLDGVALTELAGDGVDRGGTGHEARNALTAKARGAIHGDSAAGGDLGFLARATGRDATRIGYLALAHRHAAATELPAEAFYGLLRQGFPADLSALAKLPTGDLVAGLTAAADTGVIDPVEQPDEVAASLRAQEVAAFATGTGGAAASPIAEIFAVAVPDRKIRERIYGTYLDRNVLANNAGIHRFWAKLRIDKATKPHADRLRLALQLGAMTGNNVPLVTALLAKFDAGELTHPRDLAGLGDSEWAELIDAAGGAPESARSLLGEDPTTGYTALVSALVAEAYPTAHIAHRLAVAAGTAASRTAPKTDTETATTAPAARFLADNPEFDLIATPVNAATVPDESARGELAGTQRLTKLTPTFDAVRALRAAGFDSAHAITRTARDAFVGQFADSLGAEQAAAVHDRAGQVHATTVNLIADLRTAGQFDVPWLAGLPDAAALAAQIPNWEELFGSPDYCACSECRSVHSQPAYLVDLLLFLRDIGIHIAEPPPPPDSEGTVADELRRRRPDLWDIELTCENTNLQLPYVDLVAELLETVIATGSTSTGATARQTSGDAARLRVQPQHLNPAAYDKLRTAVYPWTLPFDLWVEQTRVSLDHCGVPRERLMGTLRPAAASSALTTPEAVEHLGLSPVAGSIITGEPLSPGRTLPEFYGRPVTTTAAALVEDVKNVRRILDAGQLRYAELAELLTTRFVNPTGSVSIVEIVSEPGVEPEHPCDTNYLELQGLDVYTLDRLHRFVRLWRASGWSAVELDQVLFTGPNRGRLDGAALRCGVAVARLADRLDLTVEQALCCYDTLPTYRYPTAEQPPLYDRLFADPSVVQLDPGQVSPFELNATRTELRVVGSLTDPAVTAALLAVLEVTDAELAELVTGRRSVAPNRLLNLANLSALYRTVTLARALDLPIPDLLRLIELYGNGGPFPAPAEEYNGGEPDLFSGELMKLPSGPTLPDGGPEPELSSGAAMDRPGHPAAAAARLSPIDVLIADTERFLDAVAEIRARGLTVAEVDAVLTGAVPAHDGPLPDDAAAAATLTGLRSALQAVYRQTATTSDEKGDLTRKSLALLGWDAQLVSDVVTTLLGSVVYSAPLDALPAGVDLPAGMRFEPPAEGEPGPGLLLFTGPMTNKQQTDLLGLSGATETFKQAVGALYATPRTFVATKMKALRLPIYSAPLDVLPTDFKLPTNLVGKVFYDVSTHSLRSKAYLSGDEIIALHNAVPKPVPDDGRHADFHAAVENLKTAQEAPPQPGNTFLGPDMFDSDDQSPASRFSYVLTKLNPYLRRTLSEITVKQQLGAAVGLDAASADVLLGIRLRSVSQPLALQDFLTPRFVGSDPAVVITRGGVGEQFATLTLLCRVALVLRRLRITAEQIPWVFDFAAGAGWLDLNLLPARPFPGASPLFGRFVRLLNCARLRDGVPGAARTLRAVFTTAREPGVTLAAVLDELARQTTWDRADLDVLTGQGLLDLGPADFHGEAGLSRLLAAVRLLSTLGVSAERAAAWLPADLTLAAAQAAWQTAKARHALRDWPAIGGPLQDQLRERRRAALVAYLIANPLRYAENRPYWHDANTMFDYFLLDVEMGACQLTTRIAQAIFSVQLYVQRIRLNLETVNAHNYAALWQQWEWLKSYRLWEANQKVFLYPENYFEPDLRATKSPFFVELENELKQKELTADHVETVFQHYLEQLGKVSTLRPCGVYTDVDDPNGPTVHVFGHSVASPREYYYRAWVGKSEWTPWQRMDIDIEADTLVPVVWNRRLYLFWPTFTLASDPGAVTLPKEDQPMPTPQKFWKIQLNWSRYVGGVWEAKKTTKGFIRLDQSGAYDPESLVAFPKYRNYYFRSLIDPVHGGLSVWVIDKKPQDDPIGLITFSGLFHFSPGLNDVTIEQERSRLNEAEIERGLLPVIYDPDPAQPSTVPTIFQNNEKVENNAAPAEYNGRVFFCDPTKQYDEDGRALETLMQTIGGEPFRVLDPSQHPLDWKNFNPFFSEDLRCYLINPHARTLTLLRDERSPFPGIERNPYALAAGSALAALPTASHGQPLQPALSPLCESAILLPGGGRVASVLGRSHLHAELATSVKLVFNRFYHPHAPSFIAELNRHGLGGLFNRRLQIHPEDFTGAFTFSDHYRPNVRYVPEPFPDEPVEFGFGDAYADYNWELFFHAPLLVAQRLSANQRFEDAQRWFHYIFDPTNRDPDAERPQRFWITKPFFKATDPQRIEQILKALAEGNPDAAAAVSYWLKRPFQPDAVARLRTTAYQKAVVMKYLDNLIAWGDQLFRQDTLESINQATQLYILADELLGRRPDEITGRAAPAPRSYRQLLATQPTEAIAAAENLIAVPVNPAQPGIRPGVNLRWLNYFCVPRNDKLVRYWDVVEDRLFKIRHCQNIEGATRRTALFGAPIDPNLLVRAAAAGVDLNTVLDDANAPLPHYRFGPMVAKAKELAAEVKAFGAALLAALEKRDAEAVARLRSGHELAVLQAARVVRQRQVAEATENVEALTKSKETVEAKKTYYTAKKKTNEREDDHNRLTLEAFDTQETARTVNIAASAVATVPDVKIGGAPTIGATFGSSNIIAGLRGWSEALATGASMKQGRASLAATLGGYDHRHEDWQFQAKQADLELKQLDSQIAAAEIRYAIAAKELENHDLQRENTAEVDRFMRDKFSSTELYDWMVGQLSTSYFQSYQLAYDVAKRAERAYRHELGVEDSAFVNFGYWDSLHKGLLAGERLSADLNRMDAAYLESNAREFELAKRVSLAQLDPTALLRLKENGTCFVSLPEAIFDLDTPGHYLRRIKNVAITVPCVAGPYSAVNLTARLLRSSVRADSSVTPKYARGSTDTRFRDHTGPVQTIVTSTGQDDTGLFETNLRDERFLPFEGAGVISEWQLSLPTKFRQFDYESITDVVLHLRYTARDGGERLADAAVKDLREALGAWVRAGGGKGLFRAFSARREFSDRWSRFLAPSAADPATLEFTVNTSRFPYPFRDFAITAAKPEVVLVLSRNHAPGTDRPYLRHFTGRVPVALTTSVGGSQAATLTADPVLDGQPHCGFPGSSLAVTESDATVSISIARDAIEALPEPLRDGDRLNPDAVVDLLLICLYTLEPPKPAPSVASPMPATNAP